MRASRADTMLKLWRTAHLRRPVQTERDEEASRERVDARAAGTLTVVDVSAPAPAAASR